MSRRRFVRARLAGIATLSILPIALPAAADTEARTRPRGLQPAPRVESLARALVTLVYNGDRLAALDTLVSDGFVSNDVRVGRENFRTLIRTLRVAFPDLNVSIEDVVASGDRVALRMTLTGTHRGPYMSIAATHRRVRWGVLALYHMDNDGRLDRRWIFGEDGEPQAQLRR